MMTTSLVWCAIGFVILVILFGIAWARAFKGHADLDEEIQKEINTLTDEDVYGDDFPKYGN